MKIEIQSTYIQKSRIFFYPLLGIRRGSSVTPVSTHMTWENVFTVQDYRFIAVYHLRDDQAFKQFEEKHLLGNRLFDTFYELENGDGAYVFDFHDEIKNYKCIVNGKYSRLEPEYKASISNFFKNHHRHHNSISSYLYPEKFHEAYAKDLLVTVSLMKEVVETCSLPDLKQENLEIQKKVVTFTTVNHL
jgi:hypothetical protein